MYLGKCLCGAIHISVVGKIKDIIHCHCSLCRKSTGSAFATNGFVNSAEFKVGSGSEKLKTFIFKPGRKRHFCTDCGCPVFSSNDEDLSRVRVRLGLFDSDINEKPISHNFVTSKANWEDLDAKLPRYEAFEPNRK